MLKRLSTLLILLLVVQAAEAFGQTKTLQEKLNGDWRVESEGNHLADASIVFKNGQGTLRLTHLADQYEYVAELSLESETEDSLVLRSTHQGGSGPIEGLIKAKFMDDNHFQHIMKAPDNPYEELSMDFRRK